MEIIVSGTSGELADFTERMIGVRDVSSQKPYEAKPGYVPLRDFQTLVKAARGANRDTAQKEPSTANLTTDPVFEPGAPPTASNPEKSQAEDEQD